MSTIARAPFLQTTLTVSLLVLILPACQREEGAPSSGSASNETSDATPLPSAADRWPSPSVDGSERMAVAIETTVNDNDVGALNRLFAWEALMDKVTGGVDANDKWVQGFRAGMLNATVGSTGLAASICKQVSEGGSYVFLKTCDRDGRRALRFRLLNPDGAINYHELLLGIDPDGETKILDLHVFLSAENISTTLRRGFLPVAAHQNRSFIQRLTNRESDAIKHFKTIQRVAESAKKGNYEDSMKAYKTLPDSLKNRKDILIYRLLSSQNISDEVYFDAIEAYRQSYPNDPCIDMMSIDRFLLNDQYDEAIAAIDRVNASIDGDPYLTYLKGAIYWQRDDLSKARELMQKAIEEDENLRMAYLAALAIEVKDEKWAEAVSRLDQLCQHFEIDVDTVSESVDITALEESDEFQAWIKSRSDKNPQ